MSLLNPRLAALALSLAAFGAPSLAAPSLTGLWLDQSGRAGIDIEPCGAALCGKITWLKMPLTPQGAPKTDINNPEPSLQPRKICGLTMLYGFAPDGAGGWKDGYIYDPTNGKTYNANLRLAADGTLAVRGYLEFTFMGKTQTWTRPPQPLPNCT